MKKENPRMVLRLDKREGIVNVGICFLVFYEESIVLAHLSHEKKREETKALKKQLKADGIGLLKAKIILTKYWRSYGDKYYKYGIEEVIGENPLNFKIDYLNIHQLKFIAAIIDENGDLVHEGKVEIRGDQMKVKFAHDYEDANGNIKMVLDDCLKTRLKYKKEIIRGFAEKKTLTEADIRRKIGG